MCDKLKITSWKTLIKCICLAALISIILFRYESENNMAFYVILSSVFYLAIIFMTIFLWLDSSFDFAMYAICSVPIGLMVGTLIAIIINGVRNSSLK